MPKDFEAFIPIGIKKAKTKEYKAIFNLFSNGNDSGRDNWVYNFQFSELLLNAKKFADTYNSELDRWQRDGRPNNLDDFLINDEKLIKWTRNAKRDLRLGRNVKFSAENIRNASYRPFTRTYLYSGKIFGIVN